jgi:hypothetical protein
MLCLKNRILRGYGGEDEGHSMGNAGSSSNGPSTSPERGGGPDRDFSAYGDNVAGISNSELNDLLNELDKLSGIDKSPKLGLDDAKNVIEGILSTQGELIGKYGSPDSLAGKALKEVGWVADLADVYVDFQTGLAMGMPAEVAAQRAMVGLAANITGGVFGGVAGTTAGTFAGGPVGGILGGVGGGIAGGGYVHDWSLEAFDKAWSTGSYSSINHNFTDVGTPQSLQDLGVSPGAIAGPLGDAYQALGELGNFGFRQPILLDVGKGIGFNQSGSVSYDWDAAGGYRYRTSWANSTTGMLAFDENGDGKIAGKRELAMTEHSPGAQTDLEGLASFDSNKDGVLDKKDAQYSKFKVWIDENQDGISQSSELKSLQKAGVKSISLTPLIAFKDPPKFGISRISGLGYYTTTDGKTRGLADVAFGYDKDNAVKVSGDGRAVFEDQKRNNLEFWTKQNKENAASLVAIAAAAGSAGLITTVAQADSYLDAKKKGQEATIETFYGNRNNDSARNEWIDGRVLMDLNIPGQEAKPYSPALIVVEDSAITSDAAYALPTIANSDWQLASGVMLNGNVVGQGSTTDTSDATTGLALGNVRSQITVGAPISADPPPFTLPQEPLNSLPQAVGDIFTAAEDTAIVLSVADLLTNDTDDDGDALQLTGVGHAIGGTVSLQPDGTILFTPDLDFFGTASFTYTVSDGQGGVSTATATIEVANTADAPVAANDVVQTQEDTSLVLDPMAVLKNDIDVDGTIPTLTAVYDAVGGTVALVGGKVVFTPDADFSGMASFSYKVEDPTGLTSTASVTVAVAGVGDAPILEADAAQMAEDGTLILQPADLLANDSDADGDSLTVVGIESLSGGNATLLPDGTIRFSPPANFNGEAVLRYTVSDGTGHLSVAEVRVQVDAVNDTPVALNNTAIAVEDTDLVLKASDLLANDSDIDGDALFIVEAQALSGGTATVTVDGDVLFTPDADFFGSAQISYKVSDGAGGFSTATVTIQVAGTTDAPVASGETLQLVEDTNAVIAASALLANDIDVDGEVLKIVGIVGATGGTANLTPGGDIFFSPTTNLNGTGAATITYIVEDPTGLQSTATATLDITPVNDAPVVTGEILGTVYHSPGGFTIPPANLLANDTDIDGDILSISAVSAAVGGAVALAPDGSVVFTPTQGFVGQASFSYTVSDGNGGEVVANVEFPVAINTAPTVQGEVLSTSTEDTTRFFTFAKLLGNDSDPEGHEIKIVGVQSVQGANVELTATGIKVTPLADFSGTVKFNYLVQDEIGAQTTGHASFTVTPVNDAPIVGDETIKATEDTKLTLTFAQLLKNDVDVDGDSLTITGVSGASHGSVTINKAAETVTFTLDQNYHGDAGFTYTVSDGKGGTTSAEVTLDVASVNDAPTVKGELLAGVEDTVYKVKLSSLLSNDMDVDGDTLTIAAVQGVAGVGTVIIDNDYVVMTPTKNFDGNASFKYQVSDGNGGLTWSTVVVALAPVDDPAANVSKTYIVGKDTMPTVVPIDDPDGGVYTFSIVSTTLDGKYVNIDSPGDGKIWPAPYNYKLFNLDENGDIFFSPVYPAGEIGMWFVGTATYKIAVTDESGRTSYSTLKYSSLVDYNFFADIGYIPPVVIDLNGNGQLINDSDQVTYDWNGDGIAHKTAWADQGDGFLMLDRNHDGKAQAEDIIFANDHPDAETDMDGLRLAYDSNHNGRLDAGDETFGDFKIWQDANQDGISQESEIKTLAEQGITSIGLEAPRVDEGTDGGIIHRWTDVTFDDGSTTKAGDVSIAHHDTPTISVEQQAAVLIEAMASFVPETLDQEQLVTSQPIPDWLPSAEEDLKIAV